jgi:tetratricopeptide (TPR) repeat protein
VPAGLELYQQVLAAALAAGDKRGQGNALASMGNAYHTLGDARQASEHYQAALDITREIGDRRAEGAALGNLGNAYAELGDLRQAIEY